MNIFGRVLSTRGFSVTLSNPDLQGSFVRYTRGKRMDLVGTWHPTKGLSFSAFPARCPTPQFECLQPVNIERIPVVYKYESRGLMNERCVGDWSPSAETVMRSIWIGPWQWARGLMAFGLPGSYVHRQSFQTTSLHFLRRQWRWNKIHAEAGWRLRRHALIPLHTLGPFPFFQFIHSFLPITLENIPKQLSPVWSFFERFGKSVILPQTVVKLIAKLTWKGVEGETL